MTFPDGARLVHWGSQPGPVAGIRIHRRRMLRRLVAGGGVGFAESYVDGDWDSDDLTSFIELAALNLESLSGAIRGWPVLRALNRGLHRLRANTKRGARRNIAAHYDLGNAFYSRWLDETMTYSAARFQSPDEPLESAQLRKYRRMAKRADLRAEHSVLEIGCGWGGFSIWAAREIGCRVTAVTISQQQYDFVTKRIAEEGLGDRVDVRLQDYRDLTGQFDRIVSIEMLEAVGERYWPVFFKTLHERLAPGGHAALQVITIDDDLFPSYRESADFIQRYVFPGGMLPSPSVLRDSIEDAGLTWLGHSEHAADYAQTLNRWRQRFESAWPEIATLGFDERFRRLWRYYLEYCEAGFRSNRIGLVQVGLGRPSDR